MAMFVTYIINGVEKELACHVGCALSPNMAHYAIEVQADGHELEFIIERFPAILYPVNRRVVRFYGDIAKMIAGNFGE